MGEGTAESATGPFQTAPTTDQWEMCGKTSGICRIQQDQVQAAIGEKPVESHDRRKSFDVAKVLTHQIFGASNLIRWFRYQMILLEPLDISVSSEDSVSGSTSCFSRA